MGDISKHISRHEVACKCGCGMAGADIELVGVIEDCVSHFEKALGMRLFVKFNSWNRCLEHNAAAGGSLASYHPKSMATDFTIAGVSDSNVASYLEFKYPSRYGIGRYTGWAHLDVRAIKARWDNR